MARKACDLGHVHDVCDHCGGSGRGGERAAGTAPPPLSQIKLTITAGGILWEGLLCDPCMYTLRDQVRDWTGTA